MQAILIALASFVLLIATPARTQVEPVATAADAEFVARALAAGEAELAAARVAIIKGESVEVRKLGRDAIVDRTAANEELKRIAAQHKLKPAPAHQGARSAAGASIARLEKLSGSSFDREFLRQRRQELDASLRLYEEQARWGTGAFRNFAEIGLIKLKEQQLLLASLSGA